MTSRGVPTRWSSCPWPALVLLGLAALVLAWLAGSYTLAQVMAARDPTAAHRLVPYDGRITALAAAALAGAEADASDRGRADGLARQALRQDPIGVAALATLGLNAQVRGDTAGARRLFGLAQTLSRRDKTTQLWAIEDAVGRGDIPGALHHYDLALRTSPDLSGLLFPVLAAASADPAIRAALIRTLAARPDWGSGFVYYLAGKGSDPQATATLLLGLRRAGVPVTDSAWAGTINALIGRGLLDRAWFHYAVIRPGADRSRSRDPRFAAMIEAPSQLDWNPVNDDNISTSIQSGIFDFAAPASIGGPLLRQMQLLPPGRYRLAGHGDGIDQPDGSRPYWVLTCQDGRDLGRVVVTASGRDGGRFAGDLTVPAGCPVQTLTLMARPSDMVSGLAGQIDRVELVPLR